MSSVALYSKSAKLRLPLRSIVEEYKVSKVMDALDAKQLCGRQDPRSYSIAKNKKEV